MLDRINWCSSKWLVFPENGALMQYFCMTKARYTYVSITLGIREPASVLNRTLGIREPASLLDSRERYIPRKKGVACETARMRIHMRILKFWPVKIGGIQLWLLSFSCPRKARMLEANLLDDGRCGVSPHFVCRQETVWITEGIGAQAVNSVVKWLGTCSFRQYADNPPYCELCR